MQTLAKSKWTRWAAGMLIALFFLLKPVPAARADSGVNPVFTIGLLVVVVGVLGWTAWKIDAEDKADSMRLGSFLPIDHVEDRTKLGLYCGPDIIPESQFAYTAGLALSRDF